MKVHYSPFFPGLLIAFSGLGLFTLFAEEPDPGADAALKGRDADAPGKIQQAKVMSIKTYGRIVEASFMNSLLRAIELRKQVKLLVTEPTLENHISAKMSWVQAWLPYLQSEALFSYADTADSINSWPIDPGYIDYVEARPESGIISNPDQFPDLSPEALDKLNGQDGATTGYHVIEFLLWGEVKGIAGRGKRTHIDYDAGKSRHAERRAAFLVSCCDHLIRQLAGQLADWKGGVPDNARARYEQLPVEEAIGKIFAGINGFVARNPGLHKSKAIKKGAKTNLNRATFSGLGYMGLVHNAAGIANIATGAYVGIDGKVKVLGIGLIGMAEAVSTVRSERLRHYMNASMRSVKGLNASLNRASVHDGELPQGGHSRIFTNAFGYLLKEIDKLAVDLEP
jgi:putative iron-regulated protein